MRLLRGEEPLPQTEPEVRAIVGELKASRNFELAARLIAHFRQARLLAGTKSESWLAQQHVQATYKNQNVPLAVRASNALALLEASFDLAGCRDQETLGIAGSVYKLLWEATARKVHLESALGYYLKGHELGCLGDRGYTGINAAFLCEALTASDSGGMLGELLSGTALRAKAARIREELIAQLTPLAEAECAAEAADWWLLVTLAEAHFGAKDYPAATKWLARAMGLQGVARWQQDATAQQMIRLWQLQGGSGSTLRELRGSHADQAIELLMADSVAGVKEALIGRVGLGLSGGGYRASLYHIGVLAKLAECDLLRYVEVVSCVSGGSIVGAQYYLEVQSLLERKSDDEITRQDYIDVVESVMRAFLEGTRFNVRMQAFADFRANLRMGLDPSYSRTERAAELFDRELFSRVSRGISRQSGRNGPITLDELRIRPKGGSPDFDRRFDNWRRRARVPELILNCTTLNTGHNWQFTPRWLGEPPCVRNDIDCNYQLRRAHFEDVPESYRRFPLRRAVGASASVPALFEPVVLEGLFPNKTVRLVDGGVHDNQGVFGLLEQDCTVMLLSDASGQTESQDDPAGGFLTPLMRSSDILQARVRVDAIESLELRVEAKLARGLMYVHLKRELQEPAVDWIDCNDPGGGETGIPLDARPTSYGIPRDMQKALSAIRTDLDCFGEVEAYGLMTSGYRMTEADPFLRQLMLQVMEVEDIRSLEKPWQFLQVEEAWRDGAPMRRELLEYLQVASRLPFKAWHLDRAVRVKGCVGAVMLAAVGPVAILAVDRLDVSEGGWGLAFLLTVTTAVIAFAVLSAGKQQLWAIRRAAVFIGGFLFAMAAKLQVRYFDPIYLRLGQLSRYLRGAAPVG
ncbi:MAG: patatin-like phospholipase family protein [Candidatus Wallbacteria bacterium]|nr:patatin-like phospholipase family protein [Candidatus Wallbacteria bacterium]